MSNVRSPLKYVGGKYAAADRIVAAFPDASQYDTFVDVCGGAAHVLCAKPQAGHKEVYNDLDDNLVTFWLEVQTHGQAVAERLQSLPYARSLYYDYYRSLFDGTALEPFERAVRWFYVLRGTSTGWMRRSPVGWSNMDGNVRAYHSVIADFAAIQRRFSRVAIDNRDALSTLARYDSPRTLFYIDPPYVGAEHYYEVSKHGFPHETLAEALQSVKGLVALSYYPHPTIDALYPVSAWRRVTWQQAKTSQSQHLATLDIATEMLLTNYGPAAQSLWSDGGAA